MAISASTVWEIEQGGSDTNGGGVNPATVVTDYSRQASAQVAVTNAAAVGTGVITSVSALFTSAMVGNGVYLQGGSNSLAAGWYQIITFTSSTSVTVDRNVATGTGITMNIGGALASCGVLSPAGGTSGHLVYVQNNGTPIVVTSATLNVSGGGYSSTATIAFIGYTSNRTLTNTDTPPTINYGITGIQAVTAARGLSYNLAFNGNGQTNAGSVGSGSQTTYVLCSWTGMNVAGSGGNFIKCTATGNSASVFNGACFDCEAYSNTATPYVNFTSAVRCLSYNNTGSTTHGFFVTAAATTASNCIAFGNGGAGFHFNGAFRNVCENCHAENNTSFGYNFTTGIINILNNCSGYNNTAGNTSTTTNQLINNFIAVTAGSVFVNAASANFALNNTINQGALLRAAGYPASFPRGLTAAYGDIGAAQHQDSGGGGTTYTGFFIQ